MQGKGLIQFFLVTLIIVCIYQLSFTWVASNIEKDAAAYAESNVPADLSSDQKSVRLAELKTDYLIQKANEDVYNLGIAKYNYDEVKERAINLGLDLQGGMSVVLEVSKYDLITSLSNNPKNPKLLTSLDKARAAEGRGEGELIDLFVSQYEKDNPGSQLVTLFTSRDNTESLPATSSNDEVRSFLKDQAERGINSTYTKLKERIDKFGVSQPYITLQQNTGRIIIELPGVDNPKQVRKLLQSTANLQFWETYTIQQLSANLTGANEALRLLLAAGNLDEADMQDTPAEAGFFAADTVAAADAPDADTTDTDNLLLSELDSADSEPVIDTTVTGQGPLSKILLPPGGAGPVIGYVNVKDTAQFMRYMSYEEVQAELPGDARIMLASSPVPSDKELYEVYAMKARLDGTGALLEGDVISSASQSFNPTNGSPEVTMTMKSDGAKAWRRITSENKGAFIAITLDNQVYSAPRINEEIPNGRSVISGSFDIKEAQILSNILEVGKLPVPSRIVQEDIVGPSLGKESIRVGLLSLIAGLILVVLFMIFYYSRAGIISDIALLANIFFIFGVLASLGATLTLPGIAGLVLTMGMAVDANVIIFERIREEMAKGKTMVKAVADGYLNSYSAIIDANITTLIIGGILSQIGTGPVKGFAIVLIIGILSSLFCSIFVTRLILDWMGKKDIPVTYYTSITKGWFNNLNINFMDKRRSGYIFSIALTVLGTIFMFTSGFDLGVDFKGGRTYTVMFDQPVSPEEVRTYLTDNFDNKVQVKTFSGDDKLKITTAYMIDNTAPEADSIVAATLHSNLSGFYANPVDYDKWDNTYKESQMKVEATVADDIKSSAATALLVALGAIFLYIVVRFRRWQFGLGALISLVHDAFMVVALFAILKNIMPFTMEINEAFIAALLTVIGYSINDTVVVFDRIREYLRESRAGSIKEVFNAAINQTMSRTLITSGTTLLSIVVLLIFGNDNIQGFAFALFIGILFGTYSSIFVASALAVDFYKRSDRDKTADKVMK